MTMTAHDVRHLRVCPPCRRLLDKRESIPLAAEYLHGKCYIKKFGFKALLKLPLKVLNTLRLDDIGQANMLRLIKALNPATRARRRSAGKQLQSPRRR